MHGVYLLWWVQERHVSPATVAAVLAAGDLALTALELPTGWLADRYGHRVCLIAGSALQVVGMIACWLGQGIPGLLAASVLVALGDAFRSGADQALLYRSCVAIDREADFQTIEARTRSTTLVALVVLLVMGGAIVARWGFAVGWILETIMSAAGLLIACLMVEPPAAVDEMSAATAFQTRTSVRPTLRIAIVATLAALIVPASCLAGLAGGAAFFAQTSAWANVERSTILVAVVTLAEAMGAYVARYVPATLRMQLLLGVIGVGLLAAAVTIPSALIPATVGLSWLLGAAEPLRATAIQRSTHDSIRARTASLASACDKAAATIALLVAGRLPR